MAVGAAGGDVGVVDHVPARAGPVVFLGRGAVGVLGHPADRGVLQMDDHRPAGVQLAVELVQAGVQIARKAAVAGGRPDGPVRPHPGPRVDRPVQDGAGVAQGVQAALARRLVADGKDLGPVKVQHLDAAAVCKAGGGGAGQQGEKQGPYEQKRRQDAADAGSGVHGKKPSFWWICQSPAKAVYQKKV